MSLTFTRLTRLNIRRLPPGSRLIEHGIVFERLPNGDGKYSINIMVDSIRVHRVVGMESDGTTRSQAEEFIAKVRSDARANRLSLPSRRKISLQLHTAANQYLDRLRQANGSDLVSKERRLRLHLVPYLGEKILSKISSFDVERYKKHRLDQGAANANVNRDLSVLSHLFNQAVSWGWVDRKPAIKRLKEGRGRITYLTTEQASRLLAAAKESSYEHLYAFVLIGLSTGMRRHEILCTRVADIDVDKLTIYIPRAKAGPRVQPITQHLATYLEQHAGALSRGTEWLFPARSASGHAVDVSRSFRMAVIVAGLNPHEITPHTLRHSAISHLVQSGVDLPTVQRIAGHSSVSMTVRYAHQDGNHIKSAMDALQQRWTAGTITPELHIESTRAQTGRP